MKDGTLFKLYFTETFSKISREIENQPELVKQMIYKIYEEVSEYASITWRIESDNNYPLTVLVSNIITHPIIEYYINKYILGDKTNEKMTKYYTMLLEVNALVESLSEDTVEVQLVNKEVSQKIENYYYSIIPDTEKIDFSSHHLESLDTNRLKEAIGEDHKEKEVICDITKVVINDLLTESVKTKLTILNIVLGYAPFTQEWYKEKITNDIINIVVHEQ